MASVNRPLYECLLKLRNLNELAPFKAYLEDEMKMHVDRMVMSNDDRQMTLAQGSVRAINGLLSLIEDSAGVLDKERRG